MNVIDGLFSIPIATARIDKTTRSFSESGL